VPSIRMNIDILMATYNGERFLREQLDSILGQTCTLSTLEEACRQDPNRIRLVHDSLGRLGAPGNFARLLDLSDAPYIMFSDQDDVWLPDKVRASLAAIRVAEQAFPNLPLLVHTDLVLVDSQLRRLADSFWTVRKVRLYNTDIRTSVLHDNVVTGCTVMMNRRAKEIASPFPERVRMHDWWVAANVAEKGRVIPLPVPTVLYRQHETNSLGAFRGASIPLQQWPRECLRYCRHLGPGYQVAKRIVPHLSFSAWCWGEIKATIRRRILRVGRLPSARRS
jgi:glycosyltransferase involved in cell wall biosynthesis